MQLHLDLLLLLLLLLLLVLMLLKLQLPDDAVDVSLSRELGRFAGGGVFLRLLPARIPLS